MELVKNKIHIVNYFLPRNAKIVTLENYCQEPAILEVELGDHIEGAMVALYKKDDKYYLLGIKKEQNKWKSVWNRSIKYKSIQYFKITHVQASNHSEVAIAGKIEGMIKNQLMLLEWENNNVHSLLDYYIDFDKIYIQDVDGIDGIEEIILWQNQSLEAYNIYIYRYKEKQLIEDKTLEPFYYPIVVGYYEYLKNTYPEEAIYEGYLEDARMKSQRSKEERENLLKSRLDIEPKEKEPEMLNLLPQANQWSNMDFLSGKCAYLEDSQVEEDVFLIGRKIEKEESFKELQLVVTYDHQSKNQVIRLEVDKVYDYEMLIGRFFEKDIEQIFIKVNFRTHLVASKCWLIGIKEGYLHSYLQREMYLEDIVGEGIQDEGCTVEKLGEGYMIDLGRSKPCILAIQHRIWENNTQDMLGYKLRLFKGENNQIKWYKTFVMREEKGG